MAGLGFPTWYYRFHFWIFGEREVKKLRTGKKQLYHTTSNSYKRKIKHNLAQALSDN